MNMQNEIDLQSGQIIGFYDKSHFSLGLIVSANDREAQVWDVDEQLIAIPLNRIMLYGQDIYETTALRDFQQQVEQQLPSVDLETLWRQHQHSTAMLNLTELIPPPQKNDVYSFALYLTLSSDRQYFQTKGRLYQSRSPEQRELFVTEEEQLQQEKLYHALVADYIEAVITAYLQGSHISLAAEHLQEQKARWEADLYDHLAIKHAAWLNKLLRGMAQKHFAPAAAFLEQRVEDIIGWLRLDLQQIDVNTPRRLAVSGLPVLFAAKLSEQASQIKHFELSVIPMRPPFPAIADLPSIIEQQARAAQSILDLQYLDMTVLRCFTIDADETQDRDDALSVVQTNFGWQIGIHISKVEGFVRVGSPIDAEAYLRTSSIYLPGKDVPMLPERISHQLASLQTGVVRPVITALVDVNSELEIIKTVFVKAAIKVTQALSYQTCDEQLCHFLPEDYLHSGQSSYHADRAGNSLAPRAEPHHPWLDGSKTRPHHIIDSKCRDSLHLLYRLAHSHLSKRIAAGAVSSEPAVISPARHLVAELMVIYNAAAAHTALQAGIPFLYRCLEDKIKVEKDAAGMQRIMIPASQLTFAPVKHQAMGLEIYAQVTSPLRRYSDLINQRQLTAKLEGRAIPYTQADLQSMLLHLNQTRRKIKQL